MKNKEAEWRYKKVERKKPKGKEKWKTDFHGESDAVLLFLILGVHLNFSSKLALKSQL
jgi:hypothetical protein